MSEKGILNFSFTLQYTEKEEGEKRNLQNIADLHFEKIETNLFQLTNFRNIKGYN